MTNPIVYRIATVLTALGLAACTDAKPGSVDSAASVSSPVTASTSQTAEVAPGAADVKPNPSGASPTSVNTAPTSANVPPAAVEASQSPSDVVRRYYDAISRGRYDSAYALWENEGKASGQTRTEFANGFARTESETVTVGDSVSIEGAAGSQYATVPVTVEATQRGGAVQHFTGTYTLRRSMVDGATAAQRSWHIYSAKIRPGL